MRTGASFVPRMRGAGDAALFAWSRVPDRRTRPGFEIPCYTGICRNFPSSAGKAAGDVMRFWRSDDQRIQWLAAKFGNYLVDANARFAASSKSSIGVN